MSQSRADWTQAITKREMHASMEKRKNKYGATKVEVDGLIFDSKREAGRWRELVLMQSAGQITDLRRQEALDLMAWSWRHNGDSERVGSYVADFTYQRDGRKVIEDAKSPATRRIPLYRLKKKMVMVNYGIEIQEV